MDHTVLPANYTMPAFTPQPQSIIGLWLVHIYRPTEGRRLSRPFRSLRGDRAIAPTDKTTSVMA